MRICYRAVAAAFLATFCLALGAAWRPAEALPRFALREGLSCSGCHVNPTGGGLRNSYGIGSYARQTLARESDRTQSIRYDGDVAQGVRIGADMRFQYLKEQADGGSSGYHAMAASIYLGFEPIRDVVFYLRYDPENSGTEGFAILQNLWGPFYIKGGAFLPDYGIRLDDHTAYVRGGDLGGIAGVLPKGLLFEPNYRDAGIELGYERSWYRLTLAQFNGNRGFAPVSAEKATVYRGEIRPTLLGIRTQLGYSYYKHTGATMKGYFGGFSRGRLTILGELDSADHLPSVDADHNVQAYAVEAVLETFRGVHLYTRFDTWDPDTVVPAETFKKLIVGLEIFPFPYVEIRPQMRFHMEPNSAANPNIKNDLILIQLHLWL